MLQRKQTVFLVLAFILTCVCLSLPIGTFMPQSMEAASVMFNLWIKLPDGTYNHSVWPMFMLLLMSCPVTLMAIFAYKNRKSQSRICLFSMLFMLAWYVAYAMFGFVFPSIDNASFLPSLVAALPLVNIILLIMARRSIIADEALVRAADRIR